MPRKKIVKEEPVAPAVEPIVEPVVELPDSPAKAAFRELIAKYKIQNPVKYAHKEAALLKKLNSL